MPKRTKYQLPLIERTESLPSDHPPDVRLLCRECSFAHFKFETVVTAPSNTADTLLGASLKLGGTFVMGSGAQPTPTAPNDVRVYMNEHDITDAFKQLVVMSVSADETGFRSLYREAMNRWLDMLVQYPGPGIDRAAHDALRDQLLVDPISSLFDSLGSDDTIRFGYGGTLHLFNFLYRDIPLQAITLADVIDHVNDSSPGTIDPTALDSFKLVVSLGPSRYHTAAWTRPSPRGGITLDVLYEYHNPLNDVIDAIKDELEAFEEEVLTAVERIDQKFWPDDSTTPHGEPVTSIVKHFLIPLETTVGNLKNSVDDLDATVTSHDHQVQALVNKADELKTAIDAI